MQNNAIAFLGPEGSYSHRATHLLFSDGVTYDACSRFEEIFQKVEQGQCTFAVLPIENNTAGIVNEAVDLLIQSNLEICAEYVMPVHHSLLAPQKIELSQLETLYSMTQPYYQSKQFIDSELSHCQWQQTPSSSKALEASQKDPKSAAIGFEDTGRKMGLEVLASHIQTRQDNATRFFVLSKGQAYPKTEKHLEKYRSTLVFTLENEPGSLLSVLDIFKSNDINMCHIESRRTPLPEWEYYFFVSLEVQKDPLQLEEALKSVREITPWTRFIGHYPLLA